MPSGKVSTSQELRETSNEVVRQLYWNDVQVEDDVVQEDEGVEEAGEKNIEDEADSECSYVPYWVDEDPDENHDGVFREHENDVEVVEYEATEELENRMKVGTGLILITGVILTSILIDFLMLIVHPLLIPLKILVMRRTVNKKLYVLTRVQYRIHNLE
ncbi:hypothetical protein Droror1_Dr00006224 [Drosera rotundifolia]